MKSRLAVASAAALLVLSLATPARADVTLTPFVGALFGGQLPVKKAAYGVSLAAMGAGVFGAEFDFSWSPNFVDATAVQNAVTEANVTGNLIVGIPIGGTHGASFRPYLVGGGGLLRATAKQSDFAARINSKDFAWDMGGGVLATFNAHVGVRGDVRYFHSNSASNEYKFWRGTGGLAFKF
jgi:Outer membrane protein beta-barrel domain